MDAHELFKQLTCGAALKPLPKSNRPVAETDVEIKDEKFNDDEEESNANNKKQKKIFSEDKLKLLREEKVNELRNKHHINVTGHDVPALVETFEDLVKDCEIPQQIVGNLANCGYTSPTPVQMQAIPIMAKGHSLMVCAPTGSGKTAAFLVPIIKDLKKPEREGFRAVVLCPTRELAKQTQRECLRLTESIGITAHILSKINQAETKYGPKSNKKFDILITTPNRICYLLKQDPCVLDLSCVRWLVLDEADKLFEEGKKSFREQFDEIFTACSRTDKRVGLFSATWAFPVVKWGRKNLTNMLTVTIGQRNSATDTVDQELLFVGNESGKLIAFRNLLQTGLKPPVLVFVDSKDRAQQLYSELIYDGINIDVIHGDRTQQERDHSVKLFREGKTWVLICTELIGRGIDFIGVNLVVNYDFPPSSTAYIHRIGRTGRAGRRGKAVTYFTQDDKQKLKSIANIMKNSGCQVPEYMLTMKKASKRTQRRLEKTAPQHANIRVKGPSDIRKKKKANVSDDTSADTKSTTSITNGKQNGQTKHTEPKKQFATKRKSNQANNGVQKKKKQKPSD